MKELYYAEGIDDHTSRVIMVDYSTDTADIIACGIDENDMSNIIDNFDRNGKKLNVHHSRNKTYTRSRDAFKGLVAIQLLRYKINRFRR